MNAHSTASWGVWIGPTKGFCFVEWSKQIWLTAGLPWKIKVRISLPPPVLLSALPLSNCRTIVKESWFEEVVSVLAAYLPFQTLRWAASLQTPFLLCQPGPLWSSLCKGHWRKTGILQEGGGTCSFWSISCSCQCLPGKGHWPWQQQLVPVSRFEGGWGRCPLRIHLNSKLLDFDDSSLYSPMPG